MQNRGLKFFVFVCWIQAAILAVTALQTTNKGQTPSVVILGALASAFLLGGVMLFDAGKSEKGTSEVVLRLPPKIVNRLHDVRHMIGADDLVVVCREAFKVYDTLVTSLTKDGAKIFVEYPDGKREEFVILSPKSDTDKPASEVSDDKPRDSIAPQIR